MKSKTNNHSEARVEFTSSMKRDYTILAPDIFPLHTQLIRQVFLLNGYKFEIMHYKGPEVIQEALSCVHNDMCYPLICTAGQALYALKSGDWDVNKTALIQFQTGGGCRASNYVWLLRKALKSSGFENVPVIALSFNNIEKNSGFKVGPSFILQGLASVIYSDMLMLLRNQTRPYEVKEGESDRLVRHWLKCLSDKFAAHKKLFGKSLEKTLKDMVDSFGQIEIEKRPKVKVGIIGEIYVKYSPFGNNGLQEFLENEGCEVMTPGVFAFVEYCFYNKINDYNTYKNASFISSRIFKLLLKYSKKIDEKFSLALKGSRFTAPVSFDTLVANANRVFDTHVEMGEGWLLPAEAVELAEKGYDNIVCTQPFGCLPNHIVARGFAKKFKSLYPETNLVAIDYDSSQSRVNQENRLKLMLSLAREKLK